MVLCPECESDLDIEVDEVDEGEIVSCPECGSNFEVVTTEPLELTKVSADEKRLIGRLRVANTTFDEVN